jgi:hypothetical protein
VEWMSMVYPASHYQYINGWAWTHDMSNLIIWSMQVELASKLLVANRIINNFFRKHLGLEKHPTNHCIWKNICSKTMSIYYKIKKIPLQFGPKHFISFRHTAIIYRLKQEPWGETITRIYWWNKKIVIHSYYGLV